MSSNEEDTRKIIAESLGFDVDAVTDDKNLIDDLGADSLDLVELVMGLESHFDIDITDETFEQVKTVADVIRIVNDTVSAKG